MFGLRQMRLDDEGGYGMHASSHLFAYQRVG